MAKMYLASKIRHLHLSEGMCTILNKTYKHTIDKTEVDFIRHKHKSEIRF